MKVILIYRRSVQGIYSVEGLFEAIAGELRNHVEVVEYKQESRWNIINDARRLRKMNADIYHVTGDIHYMALLLPWHKTVLTIHDINHFLFDLKGLKRWLYKWLWLLWPIRAVRAVTAVSKTTADNLAEHLGIARKCVTVIDNCYSLRFRYVPRSFNREYPVILQVGTAPHKNVLRIIAALRGVPCKLVLIGPLDEPIRLQLADCRTDFENRVNLTQEQIVQAYVDCDIVLFISTAEGFGLPIIEAQASGRPLITSDISPMGEVAGECGCKVSPVDVSGISEGILKIIGDNAYRSHIVKAGLRNAARYSPQTISSQYLELYKRTIEI